MIKLPKNCERIIECLNTSGFEAYIVGGCVRDSLLKKIPSDWDICTNATPEDMKEVFKAYKLIPTGIAHGTLTVLIEKEAFEVTTYRIDGEYSDHRRPNQVSYTNQLKDDLARRDFTINAMAYHPQKGLVDYFNGKQDLEKRIVRAVGDPILRFEEDALRLLRFIRFATTLSFDYEENTLKSIPKKIHLLRYIAKERIQAELNKILCAENVARGLYDLGVYGFYPYLVPKICHEKSFEQRGGHFLDVFEHSLLATGLIEDNLILRLTMFLHDIGKPYTWFETEDGDKFPEHEVVGSALANEILRELKYDNKTRKEVVKLILHHNDIVTTDEVSIRKMLSILGLESTKLLLKVKVADISAHHLTFVKRQKVRAYFQKINQMIDQIIEKGECFSLDKLALNGNDLKAMGFQGKAIKNALEYLLGEVVVDPKKNAKEILVELINKELNILTE